MRLLVALAILAAVAATASATTHAAASCRTAESLTHDEAVFGHFATMPEAEFMDEMERTLESDDALYAAAVRDIHGLGIYLYRKKYRFLRLAYIALLSGFVIATAVQGWVVWR